MVQGFVCKQHRVFHKNSAGSQDERGEKVDVDVISGAAELPVEKKKCFIVLCMQSKLQYKGK